MWLVVGKQLMCGSGNSQDQLAEGGFVLSSFGCFIAVLIVVAAAAHAVGIAAVVETSSIFTCRNKRPATETAT